MFSFNFRFALISAALSVGMTATATDVVREISLQTGTLDSSTGWSQRWTGNETSPSISMTASRNDMAAAADGINLDMREGTAGASTYTIIPEAGWRVKEISLSFRGNDANKPVTVSAMGQQLISSPYEIKTIVVTPRQYDSPAITLTGSNAGISSTAFTVTLTEAEPEPYAEAIINMQTGKFTSNMGSFHNIWESEDVILTSTTASNQRAANMAVASDNLSLDLREGTAGSSNYYLSTSGSRRVVGFELTFVSNDASKPVTVTCGSKSLTSTTEPQTLTLTDVPYGQIATFTLSGSNAGITATSFKARLSETTPTGRGINVFTYTGIDPYSTVYRIPVVAYIPAGTKAGRIVAVNDFRPCGSDIGYGEVDLHISYSDDGGLNWSDPADPVDAQGNHVADGDGQGTPATSNENRDCGFGDPVLVADCETGDLLMLGTCGRVSIGQATRAIPQGIAIWHSKDGGATWTQWEDITESILTQLDNNCEYGAVDGFFFTAGRMVQSKYIKVGSHYRVYVVAGGASRSRNDTQCWVFYTDDFGKSWHILGDPMKPALTTGGSEPKCEELPDGSVLFSGRAGGGVRNWNIFSYTDIEKAEGYWDKAVSGRMVTGAASCNGDALIIPVQNKQNGEGAYLLLQSTPCHPSSRINVGINYKVLADGFEDFGTAAKIAADWDGHIQVTSLPSAYSSLTIMPDGTIGFIYEEATFGHDYCEVYRNLTVEDITAGKYTYAPDTDSATALGLTRQMVNGRLEYAKSTYASRTELLTTLEAAAQAFNEAPSTEAYLLFNRAYNAVVTNTPMDSISEINAEGYISARYFDLLGRPVDAPRSGSLLIDANSRTLIRIN